LIQSRTRLLGEGDLDLNTGLELDRSLQGRERCDWLISNKAWWSGNVGCGGVGMTYDLLDNLGGGVQVDETLVDPHLESVPSLGTLTTGTASRGDNKETGT
jgi:hypothetical protein